MGRAPCCDKNGLKKGPWTPEEDQKLLDYINKHGHGSWRTLPKNAGLARCGKSCRLRWTNYLRPDIKRGRFSFEEEETIIQLHGILGNKWSAIAARLPGRTDNEIKNYWNTHIRKRLLKMGIDPVTHAPRLDLHDLASLLNLSVYNPVNQIALNKLLALDPLVSNELLRIASPLLLSQQQNQNLLNHNMVHQQFPQVSFVQGQLANSVQAQQLQMPSQIMNPTCTTSSTAQMIDLQLMQSANISQFQSVCDELDNFLPNNAVMNNEIMDPCMTTLNSDSSTNFSDTSEQNFNLMSSALSTAASSPTNLNSTSTYINSSSLEDERDSYCSNDMFKFQFSDLLDMSDFL